MGAPSNAEALFTAYRTLRLHATHESHSSSSMLSQIVQLIKQSSKMQVIMASSEYDYPYLLECNGLNLPDITAVMFAGEIPAELMWHLLTTKEKRDGRDHVIGMCEYLANLLLLTTQAIAFLQLLQHEMPILVALNGISPNINKVLKLYPDQSLPLFCQMAERGFAAVANPNDPIVEMIVESNIGGIVGRVKGLALGVPPTVWEGRTKYALVPTSQSAYDVLAVRVTYFEKECLEAECFAKERRWWKHIGLGAENRYI